ncbi:hypothetical protein Aduo_007910 [Ancylostoma duodenale]
MIATDACSGGTALWDIALARASFAKYFGSGIFMACFLTVLGVVLLVRRTTSPSKQYNSGLLGTIISLLLLLIPLIFMIIVIISMVGNANLSRSGVDELSKKLKEDKSSFSALLQVHVDNTVCLLKSYTVIWQVAKKMKLPMESCMTEVGSKFGDIAGTKVIRAISLLKKDAAKVKRILRSAAEEIVPVLKEVLTDFMNRIYITDIEGIEKMNVFDEEMSSIATYFETIQYKMVNELYHIHRSYSEVSTIWLIFVWPLTFSKEKQM